MDKSSESSLKLLKKNLSELADIAQLYPASLEKKIEDLKLIKKTWINGCHIAA